MDQQHDSEYGTEDSGPYESMVEAPNGLKHYKPTHK